MHELKEKNNTIYFELHNDFFSKINESNDNGIDISIVRGLVQHFIDMENQLFNRRITKFMKVSIQSDISDLRNHMRITKTLSNDLQKVCLNYSQKLNHITIRREKVNDTRKTTR